MEKYNGWTNYATWRVNLEIFDGMTVAEYFDLTQDAYDLGQQLKDYAIETVEFSDSQAKGLALDYAMAFLDNVNWSEIAEHMIEEKMENA
jgi:hypothetical protein